MTPRLVGGIAAATFAVGILTGAAGAIVIRDATTPDLAAVMADHMSGQDMASMMSGLMMGADGAGMMGGPAASAMPGSQHDLHHPASSPDGAK
jgi:hypothetical protein